MTLSTNYLSRVFCLGVLIAAFLTVSRGNAQEIPYEVKVNYSLAAENVKNGDCESAMPYLRWLLVNAPTVYNGERIHKRAVRCYAHVADSLDDAGIRKAYLDTALSLLGTTVPKLEDAGKPINEAAWEIDYGNFLVKYRLDFADNGDEAVNHFRKAYDLNPGDMDPYYVRLIVTEYGRLGMKQEAVDFMDDAEAYVAGDQELLDFFDAVRNEMFKSPEERIDFIKGQIAKDPESISLIRELWGIYRALGMADSAEALGPRILELDPTPETYREMATMKKGNGDYNEAVDLLQQALALTKDAMVKRDIEYDIALIYYDTENLTSSRNHARRALSHDSKFGSAYILIGDVYAKAVRASKFEREDKAVYWLAMDYYERAKSVDPVAAKDANKRIKQYREFMPSKEEKFFKGWKEGDTYKIDYPPYDWINESTTIR